MEGHSSLERGGIKSPAHAGKEIVHMFLNVSTLGTDCVRRSELSCFTRIAFQCLQTVCRKCFIECYLVWLMFDVLFNVAAVFTTLLRAQCASTVNGNSHQKRSIPVSVVSRELWGYCVILDQSM
jgi:hypothetical protein